MKVALYQLALGDDHSSTDRMDFVESTFRAADDEIDLFMLPEIWGAGFFSFDQYHAHSEPLEGPTTRLCRSLARKKDAYVYTGSFIEEGQGGNLYNTSLLLSPTGEILASYRKIHLFGFESREKELLTPGSSLGIAETSFGRVGLSTCYDLRFPEQYRAMVDRGVEFFLVTSAWPHPRLEHWLLLNRTRALESHAYLLACNCGGSSRGTSFVGASLVVDPWGVPLARAGEGETVLESRIRPQEVRTVRNEFASLQNRVPMDHIQESGHPAS